MKTLIKIKLLLAVALGISAALTLVAIDWKIPVGVFLAIWANNLSESIKDER